MPKDLIEKLKREAAGFFSKEDLPEIVKENRLQPCLVRCGGGRFSCPAQDVDHFISIIERDKEDYVRDVSLL
uniref:Uncharacterized protein n=1 Tax=viral metagenome TaxID=1070528 RepID=A0A6M3KJW2_9ZZZZ